MHEVVPWAATVGALLNPNFPGFEGQLKDMHEAARTIGVQIFALRASDDREVEAVFETVAQQRIPALAVGADIYVIYGGPTPTTQPRRRRLADLGYAVEIKPLAATA